MASESVFSSNGTVSVADVETAIATIDEMLQLQRNMSASIFRDMLKGFQFLVSSMEQKETEAAFEVVIKWLRLYLKLQAISTTNQQRKLFEKTIPPTVTYIIGALQHKPKNLLNYHYQLLFMTDELLRNCRPETVEKLISCEPGVIACLWRPIDFVGDFNTQMLALRLLVTLLKCADNDRQQSELEKIRFQEHNQMRTKLSSAILLANFHVAKFENITRDILNNFNMNLARNVLVYSFRCRTLHFGEKFQFFKTSSAEHFWIDLNYCPRTLTFNGRYPTNSKTRLVNVSVGFNIIKMKLEQNLLTVHLSSPAKFSKKLNKSKELLTVTLAKLELSSDEAMRLQEHDFILDYFNKPKFQTNTNITVTKSDTSSENSEDNEIVELEQAPQLEEVLQEAYVTPATPKPPTNIFQRSYELLIGNDDKLNTAKEKEKDKDSNVQTAGVSDIPTCQNDSISTVQNQEIFKRPSLPKYEKAVIKRKLPNKSTKQKSKFTKAELAQALIDESPRTSRSSDVAETPNISRDSHPICELRERKIFKSINHHKDKSNEKCGGMGKKKQTSKLSNSRKPKSNKTASNPTQIAPQQPPKQVNKVKPMNHLSQSGDNLAETAHEHIDNSGIVNISDFLDNGNESAALFNENQRRTILQNVVRIPTERLQSPSFDSDAITAAQPSRANVYENMNVSDAEPGQSYRNFRTRRQPVVQPTAANKTRVRRSRKIQQSKKAPANPTIKKHAKEAAVQKPRNSRKRPNPLTTVIEIEEADSVAKQPRLCTNEKRTLYSADMEIDLTCTNRAESPVYLPSIQTATNSGVPLQSISLNDVKDKPTKNNSQSFKKRYFPGLTFSDTESEIETLNQETTLIDINKVSAPVTNNFNSVSSQRFDSSSSDRSSDMMQISPSYSPDTKLETEFTCIKNRNTDNLPTDIEDEQSTKKRKAFLKRYFRGSTSSESDFDNESEVETCRQLVSETSIDNLGNVIETYLSALPLSEHPDKIHHDTANSPGNVKQTSEPNEQPDDVDDFTMLLQNECTLYHEHSDDDSTDCNEATDEYEFNSQSEESFVPSTPMRTIAIKNIATTTITKTSITTMQRTRLLSQNEIHTNEVSSPTRTTQELVPNNMTQDRHELALRNLRETITSTTQNNALVNYTECISPQFYGQESSNLIQSFQRNLNTDLKKLLEPAEKTVADKYFDKVDEIAARIFDEIENQEKEQQEIDQSVKKILSQLNRQYEAYQKNSQRLKNFTQSAESLLQALSEINIKKEVDNKFDNLLAKLNNSSKHLSSEQWRDFIKESTDHLINKMSNLSQL